jgi:hypothetical protein
MKKINTCGCGKQFLSLDGSFLEVEREIRLIFSWVFQALDLGKDP